MCSSDLGAASIHAENVAAAHAIKEKADAISMWTVISLGVLVAFLMRYQMMTRLEGPQQVLWLLPLLGTLAIPSIHRLVVPPNQEIDKSCWGVLAESDLHCRCVAHYSTSTKSSWFTGQQKWETGLDHGLEVRRSDILSK